MAYNRNNYYKRVRYIIAVYNKAKYSDIPDTFIVANVFPMHGINISYRQWQNIKGMQMPKDEKTSPKL